MRGFESSPIASRPYIGYVLSETWDGQTKRGDLVCNSRNIEKWDSICKALGGVKTTGAFYVIK